MNNKFDKPFSYIVAIFVAFLISTTVIANHEDVTNTNTGKPTTTSKQVNSVFVFDHYKNVVKQIPYDVEVCKQVRQGAGDGSATNEIIGAIFGGAIGNQFGEGDG